MSGFVSLVGAGPGDPGLMTRRAWQRLESADVVYHDGLVPPAIVAVAAAARRVSVARRAGPHKSMSQAAVNRRLIASARAGHRVVRLKCGDPFIFGRGGEEAVALARAGVRYEVVPGLSTATVAAALAGIPLTHRGLSSAIVIVSGHDPSAYGPVLDRLAPSSATVVVLMGLAGRAVLARRLERAGWPPATPAAVVIDASHPTQHVWRGSLRTLSHRITRARQSPGVIVIGRVAGRKNGRTR